jgi:pyrroloquinoline-quinone synthase
MIVASTFRQELEAAVLQRHCANHPMTDKWARGELGRDALRGWATEHYHFVSNALPVFFDICAHDRIPRDVIRHLIGNFREESDESRSHLDIILRFAKANGGDPDAIKRGRGLPTTEAWVRYLRASGREPLWIAGVAFILGTESQSPMLYSKVLPALRNHYKFAEPDIEHFWLHIEADEEHGDDAFDVLEKYCTTPEQRRLAVQWAYESARMRWLYFDGIYLNYELKYELEDPLVATRTPPWKE